VSRPWLLDFAERVFGSLDDDGVRHITEYFLLISKKNSKSTLAAGIMLTMLICNRRESAEFLILSPTIEAASSVFKPIRDMIAKDPELSAMFQVQQHIRTVTHRTRRPRCSLSQPKVPQWSERRRPAFLWTNARIRVKVWRKRTCCWKLQVG